MGWTGSLAESLGGSEAGLKLLLGKRNCEPRGGSEAG